MSDLSKPRFDLGLLSDPGADGALRDSEWDRLFQTMAPRLRSFFARRVESEDELDDLIANVWERAVLRISTLEVPDAVWTWLTTIGVNLLRDQGRTQTRRNRHFGRPTSLDEAEGDRALMERLAGDFLSATVAREAAGRIHAWVSDEEWELLQLWAVDELTHVEIANRIGLLSAQASRQRVSRLCARLRRQLASGAKEVT